MFNSTSIEYAIMQTVTFNDTKKLLFYCILFFSLRYSNLAIYNELFFPYIKNTRKDF